MVDFSTLGPVHRRTLGLRPSGLCRRPPKGPRLPMGCWGSRPTGEANVSLKNIYNSLRFIKLVVIGRSLRCMADTFVVIRRKTKYMKRRTKYSRPFATRASTKGRCPGGKRPRIFCPSFHVFSFFLTTTNVSTMQHITHSENIRKRCSTHTQ